MRKDNLEQLFERNPALAIMHGDVCKMIYASDFALKTSSVEVFEISGSCPQQMTCLTIMGTVPAVEVAIQKIKSEIC